MATSNFTFYQKIPKNTKNAEFEHMLPSVYTYFNTNYGINMAYI